MFRKTISSEITIAAPASAVWGLLVDLAGYPGWNPFIQKAAGTLTPGSRLTLALQIPDGMRMTIRPRLVAVAEEKELRWIGHLAIPGLFDGDHRFLLRVLDGRKTVLRQEETFSGLLVPIFGAWIGGGARRGFSAMNESAKARLEG